MGRRLGEISSKGITYRWKVFAGVIVVTSPDGRKKKMHSGSDYRHRSTAKTLVLELEREKPESATT